MSANTESNTTNRGRESLKCVLISLFVLLYLARPAFVFNWGDDTGLVPLGADIICRGGALYKDMWVLFFPGSCLWLALCFKLFGSTWLTCRLVLIFTWLALFWLVTGLARYLIKGPSAYFPAFLLITIDCWVAPLNTFQWDALAMLLICVHLLARLLSLDEKASQRRILILSSLAGTAGAFAIICYQVAGPAVVTGYFITAWLVFRRSGAAAAKTSLITLCGISLLWAAALAAYLFVTDSWQQMLNFTILSVLHDYSKVNAVPYGYSRLYTFMVERLPFSAGPAALFPVKLAAGLLFWAPCEFAKNAPFMVLAAGIFYFAKGGKLAKLERDHPLLLLLSAVGFVYWSSELHRADISRIIWGGQILIVLAVFAIQQIHRRIPQSRLAVKLMFAVLWIGLGVYDLTWHISYGAQKLMVIETRRGSVLTVSDMSIVLALQDLVAAHEKVLVYPYDTMVNFLSATDFPGRIPVLQYNLESPEQFKQVIADMNDTRVKYAVWNLSVGNDNWRDLGFPNYKEVAKQDLLMEPYLLEKYELVQSYGNYRLMKRRPDKATPGAPPQQKAGN